MTEQLPIRRRAMSPLARSTNIAARMGRWSASHWKTAVFGWLAFVLVAIAVGMTVTTKQIDMEDANVGQSHEADQILKKGFPQANPQTELVVVQSATKTVDDPAFRATVNDVVRSVKGDPATKNFRSPLTAGHSDQISKDRRTVIVTWDMKGTSEVAQKKIDAIEARVAVSGARHPGFFVGEAGSASSGKALDKMFGEQLKLAGERSIPITIIVLLLVFGALVAVGVPLLLALSGVLATVGLVALPSHLVPMDQNVNAVILLIGLAVGVDYSLFYIKREREERAAGKGSRAALEAAAATSGRSVLISGFTVMIAMAGMLFSGDKSYLSMGIATMIVVAVAMLASLTVLPALLSRLGDKVDKGRIPFVHRLRREGGENRFWSAILTPSLRHPVVTVVASAAILVALALPALHMHTVQSGLDALPKTIKTVPALDRIQAAFPGGATPALVAIKGNADSPAVEAAVAKLKTQALASNLMTGPIAVDVNRDRTVTRVAIPFKGNGTDSTSMQALHQLRDVVLPATVGQVPAVTYAVSGATANSADENAL